MEITVGTGVKMGQQQEEIVYRNKYIFAVKPHGRVPSIQGSALKYEAITSHTLMTKIKRMTIANEWNDCLKTEFPCDALEGVKIGPNTT